MTYYYLHFNLKPNQIPNLINISLGLYLIGGESQKHPRQLKLYCNPNGTSSNDFSSINDLQPTQELMLTEDLCGAVEYPLKAAKFTNCLHLTLYIPMDEHNLDSEKEVFWIGLKGIPTQWKREAVDTVYESAAIAAEHPQNRDDEFGRSTAQR